MRLRAALVPVICLPALGASPASAEDRVFYTAFSGNEVRSVRPDGTDARTVWTGQTKASGIDLDASGGQLVWSARGIQVRRGATDGQGGVTDIAPVGASAVGLAVDGDRVWFADTPVFRRAPLAGGAATLAHDRNDFTYGVAVDPVAGRVYYATRGQIEVGPTDLGSPVTTLLPGLGEPVGMALDGPRNRLFYADQSLNHIVVASTDGSAAPRVLYTGLDTPQGVAYDAATDELFWADYATSRIRRAPADGSGPVTTVLTQPGGVYQLVLLRAPSRLASPAVTGAGTVGAPLTCAPGQWAQEVPGSFVHRPAPTFSYRWARDGAAIDGANAATYTPTATGAHRCAVTATNAAGTAEAESPGVDVSSAPAPGPPAPPAPAPPGSGAQTPAPAAPSITEEIAGAPLPLSCAGRALTILQLAPKGRSVTVSGLTLARFAGRTVRITTSPKSRTITATVKTDGTFAATAPLPTSRGRVRYTASIDALSSRAFSLTRQVGLTRSGRTITLRLPAKLARKGRVVLSRQRTCTRRTVYKRLTLRRGTTRIRFPRPAAGGIDLYRAVITTKDGARKLSYSLPIAIS